MKNLRFWKDVNVVLYAKGGAVAAVGRRDDAGVLLGCACG